MPTYRAAPLPDDEAQRRAIFDWAEMKLSEFAGQDSNSNASLKKRREDEIEEERRWRRPTPDLRKLWCGDGEEASGGGWGGAEQEEEEEERRSRREVKRHGGLVGLGLVVWFILVNFDVPVLHL